MVICINCMQPYKKCCCGGMFIENIDDNIAPLIMKLNHKGYKTTFCCGGHVEDENLHNGIQIYISFLCNYNFLEQPEGFKMNKSKTSENISYDTFTKKEKKLIKGLSIKEIIKKKIEALDLWIDSLPEGEDKPPYALKWNDKYSRQLHINKVLDEENGGIKMPEQHECDLFLMSSNNHYQANRSLFNFASLGRRNINGWGVGFYQDHYSRVVKSENPVHENDSVNSTFKIVSEAISSNVIIGHLRFTSRGESIITNNHPFQLNFLGYDWLFIHNGSMSHGLELITYERRLLIESNNDSPRIFEFLRERIINYVTNDMKRSLIEACRKAYGELLDKDNNGTYNIILSNGYLSFVFIHWRSFYMLKREKENGDTAIISTIQLNQMEEWVEFKKLDNKRAKMLVLCGPTLIFNGDVS